MTERLLTDDDIAFIREPHIGYLGTVMADGSPQVTPVWVDTDGENLRFNTAYGRVKSNNIKRNSNVAVIVMDETNPYHWVGVRGTAEFIDEGADENIDALSKKYLNVDEYPFRNPAEQRVIVKVTANHKTLPPS